MASEVKCANCPDDGKIHIERPKSDVMYNYHFNHEAVEEIQDRQHAAEIIQGMLTASIAAAGAIGAITVATATVAGAAVIVIAGYILVNVELMKKIDKDNGGKGAYVCVSYYGAPMASKQPCKFDPI